jgi:hypothetical protein
MRNFTKIGGLVLAASLLGSSAFAAMDNRETITVTGKQAVLDAMTADLDPSKDHYSGFTGEQIARDIDPVDRTSAFREFAIGLSGPLDRFYDWRGLREDGVFVPTREFYDAGLLCRDFSEETDHQPPEDRSQQNSIAVDIRPPIVFGTACHESDGWHFR